MTINTTENAAQYQQRLVRKANISFQLTMSALAAMVILFLLWFFVLLPPGHPFTIASIHIVPLLLFIPALLRRSPKVFAWLCFVILLYFCQGSVTAFALPQRLGIIGLTEALLTTWLFCASMMASRYHGQLAALSK